MQLAKSTLLCSSLLGTQAPGPGSLQTSQARHPVTLQAEPSAQRQISTDLPVLLPVGPGRLLPLTRWGTGALPKARPSTGHTAASPPYE